MLALDAGPNPAPLTLYADGGTIGGSPGRAVYFSIGTRDRVLLRAEDRSGKQKRSDEAELSALRAALLYLLHHTAAGDRAHIRMDCKPLVRHVRTGRAPRHPRLKRLFSQVMRLIHRLQDRGVAVTLDWVRRSEMVEVLGH